MDASASWARDSRYFSQAARISRGIVLPDLEVLDKLNRFDYEQILALLGAR